MAPTHGDITALLNRAPNDDAGRDTAIEAIYAELRKIAVKAMASERQNHTLQPTEIANEAYIRLVDPDHRNWQNRAHFFAAAAQSMRCILVDHARNKGARKRGGDYQKVDLDQAEKVGIAPDDDLVALDETLDRLARRDPRQARIVELKYFGGLTDEETAEVVNISVRTVKREWSVAKHWLLAELTETE